MVWVIFSPLTAKGSNVNVAVFCATFTMTDSTPGSDPTIDSIDLAHMAQCMPPTLIVCVTFICYITRGNTRMMGATDGAPCRVCQPSLPGTAFRA